MDPAFYDVDHTRPFASLGSISFRRRTSGTTRKKRSLFRHGLGLSRLSRHMRSGRGRSAVETSAPPKDDIVVGDPKMPRASDVARSSNAKQRKKKRDILDRVVGRKVKSKTLKASDDLNFEELSEEVLTNRRRDDSPRPSNATPRRKDYGKTGSWCDWEPYVPLENCSDIDNSSDWSDVLES